MPVLSFFFGFRGRIGPGSWWLGMIAATMIGVFTGLFMIASLWAWIALTVKRLHDLGKPGHYLIAHAVAGAAIEKLITMHAPSPMVLICVPILAVWPFWIGLQIMFVGGERGANAFGPGPTAPARIEEIASSVRNVRMLDAVRLPALPQRLAVATPAVSSSIVREAELRARGSSRC